MKMFKFSEPLPGMVLKGEKDTTWRINDEKDIQVDDLLSLCHNSGEEFGKAKVIWVKETTFGELTTEDRAGHEKFPSEEELRQTYSKYYKTQVLPSTRLKVIKFKLIV